MKNIEKRSKLIKFLNLEVSNFFSCTLNKNFWLTVNLQV